MFGGIANGLASAVSEMMRARDARRLQRLHAEHGFETERRKHPVYRGELKPAPGEQVAAPVKLLAPPVR